MSARTCRFKSDRGHIFFNPFVKRTFQTPLLRWYRKNRRDLPWRKTQDPYRILLSEVMLQQTQVKTVIPYYNRFLKNYPTFQTLARAPLDKVLKLWEGLGYYSRARNLHNLAKALVDQKLKTLPNTFESLIELPGIGRYTAGAVLSIAFAKDFPLVDGNVQRVFARYFGIRQDIRTPASQKKLWEIAETLLVKGQAGDYNQALMELGALICVPKNPLCPVCPVRAHCKARQLGLQNQLPVKAAKAKVPHVQIGAGVIWKEGQILISQRPLEGLLGGLWEFPGGKLEKGETIAQCVQREIQEELGIKVSVGKRIAEIDHAYSHFKITLHVHDCQYISGKPQTLGVRAFRWVSPPELKQFAFPAANQPVIDKLLISPGKVQTAPPDAR